MKNIFFILIITFCFANLVAQEDSGDNYVEGNYTEDELWGENSYEYDVYNSNDANNVTTKLAQPSTDFGTVYFEVLGARSDEGKISASLYASAEGFPNNPEKPVQQTVIEFSNGFASGSFENVPYGQYAILIFHDENGNGKIDKNLMGMPKEGLGLSGNAKRQFGRPKWEDVTFEFATPQKTVQITVRYF